METQLWDDDGFKERIARFAARQNMSVAQALAAAGVSPSYLKKRVDGRSTNTVLRLAQVLEVSPAEMLGVAAIAPGCTAIDLTELPGIDHDQLKRITVVARMMAAQLAALVYVTSNGEKIDPVVLMELVLREIGTP